MISRLDRLPLASGLSILLAMLALRGADPAPLAILRSWAPFLGPMPNPPDAVVEMLAASAAAVPVVLLFALRRARIALVAAGLASVAIALAFWIAQRHGLAFDPAFPTLTLVTTLAASVLGHLTSRWRCEKRLRHAFATTLARPHVAAIASGAGPVALDGAQRDVTVLQAGISGLVPHGDPTADLARLDRFLGPLAGRLRETGAYVTLGTDGGLTAVWNAPLDQPQHADLAVRAALALRPLAASLSAHLANGTTTPAVHIGFGIATGPALSGHIGALSRPTYAILGAPMHQARHLQQACLDRGFAILLDDATTKALPEFATLAITQDATPSYALIGDELVARSREFRALKPMLGELEANLKINAARDVLALLDEIAARNWPAIWPPLAPLLSYYRARLVA